MPRVDPGDPVSRRPPSSPPVIPGLSYLRPLGSGGFADVFLYEQDLPRRTVAVKVLLADAIDPLVRRRFAQEADLMARLSSHPSILSIHQASIAADGRPYLVTEFCPESMATEYRRQVLPVPRVLDAGVRIASALETAHRAGVLHRDIKPSNILITPLGSPVLADFGIATALGGGLVAPELATEDDDEIVAMSIPWSSPEVLDEVTIGTVASEVWSLGATIFTLLNGRSPFADAARERNERDQLVARIRKASPKPMARDDVPASVLEVLTRTMRHDPAQRHATMLELAEALRWAQVQMGIAPTPLEIAGAEWGAAAAAAGLDDGALRGPVLSTVQADSRRAARVASGTRADEPSARGRRSGGRRALVIGLVVGAGAIVVAVVVVSVLVVTGVL